MELAMLCDLLDKLFEQEGLFAVERGRIEFEVAGADETTGWCAIYPNNQGDSDHPFSMYVGKLPYIEWLGGADGDNGIFSLMSPSMVHGCLLIIADYGWQGLLHNLKLSAEIESIVNA